MKIEHEFDLGETVYFVNKVNNKVIETKITAIELQDDKVIYSFDYNIDEENIIYCKYTNMYMISYSDFSEGFPAMKFRYDLINKIFATKTEAESALNDLLVKDVSENDKTVFEYFDKLIEEQPYEICQLLTKKYTEKHKNILFGIEEVGNNKKEIKMFQMDNYPIVIKVTSQLLTYGSFQEIKDFLKAELKNK